MSVNNITRDSKELKDNHSFARVFRGPTWIQVGFGESLKQVAAATAPQRLRPTRPPLQQNASAKRDCYNSRGNFADFTVLPDDHRQTAAAKFSAFLSRRAAMCLRCDTNPFWHFFFRNRLQSPSSFRVHSRVSWATSDSSSFRRVAEPGRRGDRSPEATLSRRFQIRTSRTPSPSLAAPIRELPLRRALAPPRTYGRLP